MRLACCRLSGRLFYWWLIVAILWNAAPVMAAGPATTLVKDTVYRVDGGLAAGSVTITWPGFTTSGGQTVAAGTLTVNLGASGSFSAALVPTSGATPTGTYYRVVFHLNDGTTRVEYWDVRSAGQVTIASVRLRTLPVGTGPTQNPAPSAGFPGMQIVTSTIQQAVDDAGSTGSVLIPSSYEGQDNYSNPNNVPVLDLRAGVVGINELATRGPRVDVRAFGASGSAASISAECVAGSTIVTVADAIDFRNGQGIHLYHCGAAAQLSVPGAPAAQVIGTPGASTYSYKIAALSPNGGVSAASAQTMITNGSATLDRWNSVKLSWNASAGARAYAVYASRGGGAYSLAAIIGVPGWAHPWRSGRPFHLNDFVQPTTFNGRYYKVTSAIDSRSVLQNGGTATINAGTHVITPKSMNGIAAGVKLTIDGNVETRREVVTVTAVTAKTFTATFTKTHKHGFAFAAASDATEPLWCTTSGCTVTDNGLVYTEQPMYWHDSGKSSEYPLARGVPATPPASSLPDDLITTIVSGAGTNALTLAAGAGSTQSTVAEHDDTAAINNAIAFVASSNKKQVQYFNALPAQQSAAPMYFSYGKYRISSALTASSSNWLSDAQAIIEQTNPTADVLNATGAYDLSIEGLSFWGGWRQLSYSNGNSGGIVRVQKTTWLFANDFAFYTIGTQANANDTHLSTVFEVADSSVWGAKYVMYNNCDRASFKQVNIHPAANQQQGDAAQFVNLNHLELDGVFATPASPAPGSRWIDNRGSVVAKNLRMGGEYAGLPTIFNFAHYYFEPGYAGSFGGWTSEYPYNGQRIVLKDSMLCPATGSDPDGAVINLVDSVPGYVNITGNSCVPGTNIVRNGGGIDLDGYFVDPTNNALLTQDVIKWTVSNNDVGATLNSSAIPFQLLPYVTQGTLIDSQSPVAGNWKQGQMMQNSAASTTVPLGWTTVTTGKAAPKWTASTAYAVDQFVVPTTYNGHVYRVVSAGSSGGAAPTWPAGTNTIVTDGTVTWMEAGTATRFVVYGMSGDDSGNFSAYNRGMWLSTNTNQSWFQLTSGGGYDAWVFRGLANANETFRISQLDSATKAVQYMGGSGYDLVFKTALNNSRTLQLMGTTLKMTSADVSAAYGDILVASGDTVNVKKLQVGSGSTVSKLLSASASLTFGSIAANSCVEQTVNVSGAVDGDTVTLGVPNAAAVAGTLFTSWVSGASVVKIRACNTSGVAASLAAGSFRVDVWQH